MSNTVYHYPGDATAIKIAPSTPSTDFTQPGEQVANAQTAEDDNQSRFRETESTAQDAATAGNADSQGAKAELKADVGINAKTGFG